MKNLSIFLVITFISFNIQAADIQLTVSSKILNGNSTKVIKTSVLAKLGSEWQIPIQNEKNLFLKMSVRKLEQDIAQNIPVQAFLFEGKIIEKNNGLESIFPLPDVTASIGKKEIVTVQNNKKQTFELTINPTKFIE